MGDVFYEHVCGLLGAENVFVQEPMFRHTTFRIGGTAAYFLSPPDIEKAAELIRYCRLTEQEYYVMGNGSNLLVGDKGYQGAIIRIFHNLSEISVTGERIRAGAGVLLSQAAKAAAEHGLTGLEFAAGIPGTLGGAVVMNAGAYGGEMEQVVQRVRVITKTGEILSLSKAELDFSYRSSILQSKKLAAVEAELLLSPGDPEQIRDKMQELARQRASKQPLEFPSAGSAFKRPAGHYAGKLIMDAGLRGYQIGGARISEKHCGFIINTGKATAADVKDLLAEVEERVYTRFGVRLEPEIRMLGEF